jgi:hypothetical protein
MRIRDEESSNLGSGMEKSRIRDKNPGSATLDYCHPALVTPKSCYITVHCTVYTIVGNK